MHTKIHTKKNILSFLYILGICSVILSPSFAKADNFYGGTCGTTSCQADETCQKTYRGVLPIEDPNPTIDSFLDSISDAVAGGGGSAGISIEPKWTCVKPKQLEAPESPYKGPVGCGAGSGAGGFLSGITGGLTGGLNGIIGSTLSSALSGVTGSFLGNLASPFGLNLNGLINSTLNDPLGGLTGNLSDLIGIGNAGNGCTYNNINDVIDTRRLIAPLPVDIFNPLPLPVNVTSPNPLPVVVVDDLALYQQKELVDAPLAAQQKAKTIGIISDDLRYQISTDNLIPNNYFAPTALGIQFGALDEETGVVVKDSIDAYGDYVNYDLDTIDVLTEWYEDRQDQKYKLPTETLPALCGNITIPEAGEKSLFCGMTALLSQNNPNDLYDTVWRYADDKNAVSEEYIDNSLRDGRGYFPTTQENNKNPFINQVISPASDNQELATKIMNSTVDQAISGSGDNCFEALPQNILEGSLKPILQDGLYGVSNTLGSVLSDTTGGGGSGGGGGSNSVGSAATDLFQSLGDSLLANITQGLSCEMSNSLSGLLNSLINTVIP